MGLRAVPLLPSLLTTRATCMKQPMRLWRPWYEHQHVFYPDQHPHLRVDFRTWRLVQQLPIEPFHHERVLWPRWYDLCSNPSCSTCPWSRQISVCSSIPFTWRPTCLTTLRLSPPMWADVRAWRARISPKTRFVGRFAKVQVQKRTTCNYGYQYFPSVHNSHENTRQISVLKNTPDQQHTQVRRHLWPYYHPSRYQ